MKARGLVAVFPAYRDNPYVNLLMLAPRAVGFEVLDSTSLEGLERTTARLGAGDALHLHWTSPVVQRASTEPEARERLTRFRAAVDGAASRGALVLWTIHNVLPHDLRHDEVELELCRYLAVRADVIHAMTPDLAEVTSPFYELDPAKIVLIPHPSYQGVYPSQATRTASRERFDLADDEQAILFFGQMRPYKGLSALLSAVGDVASDGSKPVLLLAGRTSEEDRLTLEEQLPSGVRAVREHEHIPDADVQFWFRAADVVVLPYERILNSGTLHLAATFGVPVVLPDEPHLRRAFGGEEWISWFDPSDATRSLAALLDARHASAQARDAALAFSRRLAPYAISERYAELLDGALAARG